MRERLPNRRESENIGVEWITETARHRFYVTAGYDRQGVVREVFYADGMKTGTDMRNTAQDACVLVSLLLQHGIVPAEIRKSLSVVPVAGKNVPASLVGAIVDVLTDENGGK